MRWRKSAVIVGILGLLCLTYPLVEPYLIGVNDVDFADGDLPGSFDGKTVVFAADFHCGPLFSVERTGDVVRMINSLKPDLILLGGDYIFDDVNYIKPCIGELKNLKAPLGVYGVLGNHEHWADAESSRQALSEAGVTLLDNRAEWVELGGGRIRVGGVGDMWTDVQDIAPTVEDAAAGDFAILLSHNPDYAEGLKTDKVDLMLSGHTHGGQVTVFGLWAPVKSTAYGKYVSGMVDAGGTKVFVTKGIGMAGLPIRFFARPEIVRFHLHKE